MKELRVAQSAGFCFGVNRSVGMAEKLLEDKAEYNSMSEACNPYGDGKASQRIVQAILYRYGLSSEKPDSFVAKYY